MTATYSLLKVPSGSIANTEAGDEVCYLVQSRSQYRNQEAIVDVTQQLRPDGGMSNLKKTSTDGKRVG